MTGKPAHIRWFRRLPEVGRSAVFKDHSTIHFFIALRRQPVVHSVDLSCNEEYIGAVIGSNQIPEVLGIYSIKYKMVIQYIGFSHYFNQFTSLICGVEFSPTVDRMFMVYGQYFLKIIHFDYYKSCHDTIARFTQYGFNDAGNLFVTVGMWYDSETAILGDDSGKLLIIVHGQLRGVYNTYPQPLKTILVPYIGLQDTKGQYCRWGKLANERDRHEYSVRSKRHIRVLSKYKDCGFVIGARGNIWVYTETKPWDKSKTRIFQLTRYFTINKVDMSLLLKPCYKQRNVFASWDGHYVSCMTTCRYIFIFDMDLCNRSTEPLVINNACFHCNGVTSISSYPFKPYVYSISTLQMAMWNYDDYTLYQRYKLREPALAIAVHPAGYQFLVVGIFDTRIYTFMFHEENEEWYYKKALRIKNQFNYGEYSKGGSIFLLVGMDGIGSVFLYNSSTLSIITYIYFGSSVERAHIDDCDESIVATAWDGTTIKYSMHYDEVLISDMNKRSVVKPNVDVCDDPDRQTMYYVGRDAFLTRIYYGAEKHLVINRFYVMRPMSRVRAFRKINALVAGTTNGSLLSIYGHALAYLARREPREKEIRIQEVYGHPRRITEIHMLFTGPVLTGCEDGGIGVWKFHPVFEFEKTRPITWQMHFTRNRLLTQENRTAAVLRKKFAAMASDFYKAQICLARKKARKNKQLIRSIVEDIASNAKVYIDMKKGFQKRNLFIKKIVDHGWKQFELSKVKNNKFHGVLLEIWNERQELLSTMKLIDEGFEMLCRCYYKSCGDMEILIDHLVPMEDWDMFDHVQEFCKKYEEARMNWLVSRSICKKVIKAFNQKRMNWKMAIERGELNTTEYDWMVKPDGYDTLELVKIVIGGWADGHMPIYEHTKEWFLDHRKYFQHMKKRVYWNNDQLKRKHLRGYEVVMKDIGDMLFDVRWGKQSYLHGMKHRIAKEESTMYHKLYYDRLKMSREEWAQHLYHLALTQAPAHTVNAARRLRLYGGLYVVHHPLYWTKFPHKRETLRKIRDNVTKFRNEIISSLLSVKDVIEELGPEEIFKRLTYPLKKWRYIPFGISDEALYNLRRAPEWHLPMGKKVKWYTDFYGKMKYPQLRSDFEKEKHWKFFYDTLPTIGQNRYDRAPEWRHLRAEKFDKEDSSKAKFLWLFYLYMESKKNCKKFAALNREKSALKKLRKRLDKERRIKETEKKQKWKTEVDKLKLDPNLLEHCLFLKRNPLIVNCCKRNKKLMKLFKKTPVYPYAMGEAQLKDDITGYYSNYNKDRRYIFARRVLKHLKSKHMLRIKYPMIERFAKLSSKSTEFMIPYNNLYDKITQLPFS